MNRLKDETSPYLLQHADNPVDWYPWGETAFIAAKEQDKPVFVSIGYSTCHWCHVMAEESFKDSETAKLLNDTFICIKVDREERPDVDSVYMEACRLTTGGGGWPLSAFLTSEQKPFFIGTYFPKHSSGYAVGFDDLIKNIDNLWKNDRKKLIEGSENITAALQKKEERKVKENETTETYNFLCDSYDKRFGGFGSAPKFPMPSYIVFLMKYYETTGEIKALDMAEHTAVQMYKGGVFDHIGYGFARYSTDRFWLVPHFEKTLYDNAQLISAYTECYKTTRNELYSIIAKRIIDYLLREMTDHDGGFYSAQDADSEGVEGLYYLFTPEEIFNILGQKAGEKFCENYGITENGNFCGKNIPNLLSCCETTLAGFNDKLYEYRKTRLPLSIDDKIITVWNCLTISALIKAAKVFGETKYFDAALKTFEFVESNLTVGDSVFTSIRGGKRNGNGVLDDYAHYIKTCIDIYGYCLNEKYMDKAIKFAETACKEFYDTKGGFYMTKSGNKQLIARIKETYDGVIPSANSVMTENIYNIAAYTDDRKFYSLAARQTEFMDMHCSYGGESYYAYVKLITENYRKVVIACDNASAIDKNRFPNFDMVKIVAPNKRYPLINGKTAYYVCEGNACRPPTDEMH